MLCEVIVMKTKIETVKISTCCNYEVRYSGFVGLVDYGWTCNRCDRKCNIKEVEKKVVVRR